MVKAEDEPDYKGLFRNLPGRYILLDTDEPNFTVKEVSDLHLKMVGVPRENFVGKPVIKALYDANQNVAQYRLEDLQSALKNVLKTKSQQVINNFRYDVKSKRGTFQRHYWIVTLHPMLDDEGNVKNIIHTALDITDQLQIDHRLHIANKQLEQALSFGLIGTWAWHIKRDVINVDKNMARMLDIDEKQAVKSISPDVFITTVHPDDLVKVKARLAESIHKGKKFEAEYRTITANGVSRWVLARARILHDNKERPATLTGIMVDITARKRAEYALEEQSQRATDMSDSLPIILFTATPDGNFNYFNKQWKLYTGLSYDKGYAQKWLDIVHPNDVENARKTWFDAVRQEKPCENELRIKRKDGKYRWNLCRVNPILDKSGNIIVWFGSITDVDEWHRATNRQERLEHITKTLKQQRKELVLLNSSKDEFISVASHQLRTPATAVKQYIGMMLEGYVGKLTAEQKSTLHTAYVSNERQLETVNDLLRVAQADAGKVVLHKEKFDIIALLEEVTSEQQDKFTQKKQRLVFRHNTETAFCNADKARMRMVLENLVDNASKYTFEGKRISITCISEKSKVVIAVTDEGVGIDADSLPKLFQKFSRIDNPLSTQAGGTGLGLYWAYKIVLLHKGILDVQSDPGSGTTFTITLPK